MPFEKRKQAESQTWDNRCGRCRKRALENESWELLAHDRVIWINEELADPAEAVGASILAKAESVAQHPVGDAAKDHVCHVLRHDVDFVLGADRAAFQQPESCNMEQ